MKLTKSALALACGLAVSVSANAAYITTVDATNPGSFNVSSIDNDYVGFDGVLSDGDTVDLGKKVTSTSAEKYQLTFTYLFKEADYTNSFLYKGGEVFNTETSSYGDSASFLYEDGLADLDFAFSSGAKGGPLNNADNDGNASYDFFTLERDGYILLGLDDSGFNVDDNHDDMLIKVTASRVPEPGTLALLGLGLAGLGVRYRRRK